MYLYDKDPYETKYQLLINKTELPGLEHLNDSKNVIEFSNDMNDIYKNIEEYNPNMKRKILIVFDNMIADILSNKKLNLIVTELIRGRKPNIILLSHKLILLHQKILDKILDTILICKFQINKSFNKSHLIIHQILTFKTS